ncbi:DNA polymerase IV [Sediminibacterium ginsengisoli]|uniref:DNA polymerase IV n=1 Tax=Sediminibacterium ginsengisoli TaxID=413434 RepID=A0A1T4NZJ4_9BACT|nr:DNA polymerase IV [Sediminibacterium ginsengisoli]SJZ84683.1 DNA polymerase-4 [Sediminibacterium ginsengisoli]
MLTDKNRHIAHFDLDTFFVSVERLINPKLIGKPVLVGGSGDRGVVASCSYEARKFGIHSAMPMAVARRLCSHAVVVKGDHEAYSKYSRLVTDVIQDTVPVVEKSSIDEFYIDLSGMDKFFGCRKFTDELGEKIKNESGLPISYALASNKLISKVGTNEVKPNGQLEIPFGNEKSFLSPLNVVKLPGIGDKTKITLLNMGVQRIETLAQIPLNLMINLLGKHGADLHRKANGIDESPVIPFHEQKSMSKENTFQQDTTDLKFLHAELVKMVETLGFQLRSENRLTGCITVKIRYSDFETNTQQKSISYTNQDHVILKTVTEIFDKLYSRRLLVRLIGLRFTDLIPGNYQINLFDDSQEKIRLYQRIDSIKRQFGEKLILKASGI